MRLYDLASTQPCEDTLACLGAECVGAACDEQSFEDLPGGVRRASIRPESPRRLGAGASAGKAAAGRPGAVRPRRRESGSRIRGLFDPQVPAGAPGLVDQDQVCRGFVAIVEAGVILGPPSNQTQ